MHGFQLTKSKKINISSFAFLAFFLLNSEYFPSGLSIKYLTPEVSQKKKKKRKLRSLMQHTKGEHFASLLYVPNLNVQN